VPVVVVGAGPSGVTAATLLAQHGVEVLVLDRWADVYARPRAVHLDDEVYRIIARLGIADEFAQISRPAQGLRLQDAKHRVFAEFRRHESAGRHGFPQANMFDQPDLEALLRANLRQQPLITVRGEVEVTSVRQSAEGPVTVELTDRDTGRTELIAAQYVLGCDGANSVVRTSIGARMRDLGFEQRWLVVDVNTDRELGQWEGVHQVCDTERAATYMRISDRRHRWEFQLKDGEQTSDFDGITALRPLIEPWTGDVPAEDLQIVRVREYTFRAQVADRWRDRRVFLIGDAAHLTPPFIGQGLGAGLRDAANLCWKLAGVLEGGLPPSVLDTYESERRPHVRQLIVLAIWIGTAMTRGGRAGDVLRRLIAPRLHWVPGLRAKVLDSATPRLRSGELVLRRPGQRGLAGTLCPNVPLDGARRFDDVVGARFALVTCAPLANRDRLAALAAGAAVIEAKPGQPIHDWLTRGRALHQAAVIVRPDGTVLAATKASRDAILLLPTGNRVTQE
jgi:3-(3-hydroxy-phenyl)propionate hydroxylase